eukprot:9470017-Pyramimonas_sp.AAC.1
MQEEEQGEDAAEGKQGGGRRLRGATRADTARGEAKRRNASRPSPREAAPTAKRRARLRGARALRESWAKGDR